MLSVKLDDKQLTKYVQELKGLPRLQVSALNEATKKIRTDIGRKVTDKTDAKTRLVKKQFARASGGGLVITQKASQATPTAVITGSKLSTEMNKKYFSISERKATKKRRSSATIKLMGKRHVIRNSRLTPSGKIVARGYYNGDFDFHDKPDSVSKRHVPWRRLRTFSVASQLRKPYITVPLDAVVAREYKKAFARAVKRKGFTV